MQRAFHHADHAGAPGVGRHFRYGVKVILTPDIGDLLLPANQVDFTVAPVAAVLSGENIGVHRLVRAMKRAKAEMNNAGGQRVAVVSGQNGASVEKRVFHSHDSFDK
ncbi:hypothetical protein BN133_998 [Cronobacter dublinensis 582]|nr:hypothetical protein BN133_998 [Cronobacter dublinensis 582]